MKLWMGSTVSVCLLMGACTGQIGSPSDGPEVTADAVKKNRGGTAGNGGTSGGSGGLTGSAGSGGATTAPGGTSGAAGGAGATGGTGTAGTTAPPVGGAGGSGGSTQGSAIVLPIEVLGPVGTEVHVSFNLADATGVDGLYIQGHRLAFRDGRGGKGSVSLNGNAFIPLQNDRVTVYSPEDRYEGIGGSYATVRVRVPITGARTGSNDLVFRLNATDGHSVGFRVLAFNVMRGGTSLLPASSFVQDDPNAWTAPRSSSTDISEGQRLWSAGQLMASPLEPTRGLRARCADCHSVDGRDLKYFNYSNRAIAARAAFHGFTTTQGEQIASYIRSVDLKLPSGVTVAQLGRPWNPPYQPGPGLDSRPVERWAAGAGLEAVLDDDKQMMPYLFPNGINKQAISLDGQINTREMPIALQLPDWGAWLPDIHPLDLWGAAFVNETAYVKYRDVHNQLTQYGLDRVISEGRLRDLLQSFILPAELLRQAFDEGKITTINADDGRRNIMHWSAVKQWELMQMYGIEGVAQRVFGPAAAPRAWPTQNRNVFEMAPHRTAANLENFTYQTWATGKYFSTSWYHLQTILNTGNRDIRPLSPIDWNYHPDHIENMVRVGAPAHPLRETAALALMIQMYNNAGGLNPWGFGIRQFHPGRYAGAGTRMGKIFDAMPQQKAALFNSLLENVMDKLERYPVSAVPRQPEAEIEVSTYVPMKVGAEGLESALHNGRWADGWYTCISYFRQAGVPEATLERMITWGSAMWPGGNWAAVRSGGALAMP